MNSLELTISGLSSRRHCLAMRWYVSWRNIWNCSHLHVDTCSKTKNLLVCQLDNYLHQTATTPILPFLGGGLPKISLLWQDISVLGRFNIGLDALPGWAFQNSTGKGEGYQNIEWGSKWNDQFDQKRFKKQFGASRRWDTLQNECGHFGSQVSQAWYQEVTAMRVIAFSITDSRASTINLKKALLHQRCIFLPCSKGDGRGRHQNHYILLCESLLAT